MNCSCWTQERRAFHASNRNRSTGSVTPFQIRMLKVCRVLEHVRGDGADLDAQLEAIKRFAKFCLQNLNEEEMQHVRKAIRLFLDNLKEEHS